MPIRLLALVLLLGSACASAAPPSTTVPPEEIDVDAMARAKDVDASRPVASEETATSAEAPGSDDSLAGDAAETPATDEPEPAIDTDPPVDTSDGDPSADDVADVPPEDDAAPPSDTSPAGDAPDEDAEPATDQPVEEPAESVPDEADKRHAEACNDVARKLLDAVEKADFPAATQDFNSQMRTALPPEKLKQAWDSLAQFGALQARGQSHFAKNDGYIAVSVPLVFEKANLYAQVACDDKDKVAGFYVKPLEVPAQ